MDTILAVGASGECPEQLIALLQAAGYPVSESPAEVTSEVMRAVVQAQSDLEVTDGVGKELAVAGGAIATGQFVLQPIWDALRVAAAHRTGLVTRTEAEVIAHVGIETGAAQAAVAAEQAPADEHPPEGVSHGEREAQAAAAAAADASPAAGGDASA